MNKTKLALCTLSITMLFSIFTLSIFAQKTNSIKVEPQPTLCSGEKFVMPQTVPVGNEAFANFIKVMSLSESRRQKEFAGLSGVDKANLFKVKLALNFLERTNLTTEQKDLMRETISAVSADDYNKSNPALRSKAQKRSQELQVKANALFAPNEATEIFFSLNGDKSDKIELLRKYEEILTQPMNLRKQTVRELSPTDRSNVWKAQMVYFLATANFNRAQQELVLDFIRLATPRAYEPALVQGGERNEETNALNALEAKAKPLFSRDEIYAFFMGVGIHKIVLPDTSKTDTPGLRPPDCNCNYVCWGYCNGGGCTVSDSGCGWSGNTVCVFTCI